MKRTTLYTHAYFVKALYKYGRAPRARGDQWTEVTVDRSHSGLKSQWTKTPLSVLKGVYDTLTASS